MFDRLGFGLVAGGFGLDLDPDLNLDLDLTSGSELQGVSDKGRMSRGQMANANGKCKWQMANGRSGGWKGIKLGTAAEDGSQMNARCFFLVPFFFFFPYSSSKPPLNPFLFLFCIFPLCDYEFPPASMQPAGPTLCFLH